MPRSRLTYAGLVLALFGGALDLVSGFAQLQPPDPMHSSNLVAGIGLVALGFLVAGTGFAMVLPTKLMTARVAGGLMELYGIVMGLASAYTPYMNPAVADLMLGVGVLMFVDGIAMQSGSRQKRM